MLIVFTEVLKKIFCCFRSIRREAWDLSTQVDTCHRRWPLRKAMHLRDSLAQGQFQQTCINGSIYTLNERPSCSCESQAVRSRKADLS